MKRTICTLAIALLAALTATGAMAAKFKVIHSFCSKTQQNCPNAYNPDGALLRDPSTGVYYGTTAQGGTRGREDGAVFQLAPSDTGKLKFKIIYSFCYDYNSCSGGGQLPTGPLIEDTSGNLYGTTVDGGLRYGVVFELSLVSGKHGPQWVEKDLYDFSGGADGDAPFDLTYAGQAQGQLYDGVSPLFGATQIGGAHEQGVVFQLTQSNGQYRESVLYSFCSQGGSACTDGSEPEGGLLLDGSGNIFGTTYYGGTATEEFSSGAGTVFELIPNGNTYTESVLYRFCSAYQCSDGAYPAGALAMDASGDIYSTAIAGGQCQFAGGCGTVYKLAPSSGAYVESILHNFCSSEGCPDGYGPVAGVVLDRAGDLFGTAQYGGPNDIDEYGDGGGTAFEISGASFTVMHSFCADAGCADGEYPNEPLLLDGQGHVLGTAYQGGAYSRDLLGGTVFELTL